MLYAYIAKARVSVNRLKRFVSLGTFIAIRPVNPLVTNGLSHSYYLDESTFNFRGIGRDVSFLFHFSMKFKIANRIALDGSSRFAASHLGLFCFPMSHKKDVRLIWVNVVHPRFKIVVMFIRDKKIYKCLTSYEISVINAHKS